jgi:hypothetical protein
MIRTLCLIGLAALLIPSLQAEDYTDNPEAMKALTKYHVSRQFARQRLVRDLEKAQNNAIRETRLDEALAIQNYREKIKAGATIPREFPELRLALDGLRYQWGRYFDRRFGIFIRFSPSELHWQEPNREHRTKYRPIASREVLYGQNHIHFSPDFKRFIYLQPDFELRTGICLNPQVIAANKAKASEKPREPDAE